MPSYVLLYSAFFGYHFNAVLAVRIAGHGQQFVPFRHTFVFCNDTERDIQQPYITFDSRFLAVGLYPQMPVERGLQIRFGKVIHIHECQSRERAEDERHG